MPEHACFIYTSKIFSVPRDLCVRRHRPSQRLVQSRMVTILPFPTEQEAQKFTVNRDGTVRPLSHCTLGLTVSFCHAARGPDEHAALQPPMPPGELTDEILFLPWPLLAPGDQVLHFVST